MPMMKATKASLSEPSNLTDGIHCAYLLAITDEATPENFINVEKNPRSYLWHFAVYQTPSSVGREVPEYITAWSTQICSYGGKRASKCYDWTTTLIGRGLELNESIDLDPMMPMPCQVATSKKDSQGNPKDFATITGLYVWAEGAAMLQNAAFTEGLSRFWEGKRPADAPAFPRSAAAITAGATVLAHAEAHPVPAPPVPATTDALPF